ncbi:MAG: N-acetylmuramoyl-L-alanine amidase [Dehalococcoidia bacterium]
MRRDSPVRRLGLALLSLVLLGAACGGQEATTRTPRNPTPAAAIVSTDAPTPATALETPAVAATPRDTPAAESPATAPPIPPSQPTAAAAATEVSSTQAPRLVPTAAPTSAPATPFTSDPRTVVLDPGHGGDEIGAANFGVVEKVSNLDMALRVERLLAERGLRVVLTRRTDARASSSGLGTAATGFSAQRVDLQARVDLANAERATLFVSLHSNGSTSGAERGLEVYYNSQRPFAAENLRLASSIHDSILNEVAAAGYSIAGRGVKDDTCLRLFQGRCFGLFLLSPERVTDRDEILRRGGNPESLLAPGQNEIRSRATQMPAALAELLFISNTDDASLLRTEAVRDALARGVVRGITRYLGAD